MGTPETLSGGINGLEGEFKAQLNLDCEGSRESGDDNHNHTKPSSNEAEGKIETRMDYGDFPVAVKKDNVLGRYLVAKRDIPRGQILLKDKPIFTSPNSGDEPTCLGCCVKMTTSPVPCSKCGWPVCGIECENMPEHAEYECEVFSRGKVKQELDPPFSFIASEEYIKVLRGVLLSQKESPEAKTKWEKFQTLEAHVEFRKNIPKVHFMSSLAKKFIREVCNLQQIDEEVIDFVLGVIDVNAFRHTVHPSNPFKRGACQTETENEKLATFVYPLGAMAAHGCRRNVRWETLANGELEMWSAEPIKAGELLTHPYVDLMFGTPDRRRQLKEQFYFDCCCSRCADPTECGTFFSALKCPECKSGYLLPVDPLDYETSWKCNNNESSTAASSSGEAAAAVACECTKPSQYERDLVSQIQSEKKTVLEMLEFGSNLAVIGGLARILGKYRGKKVHVNHFAIVDVEYNLVKRMARISKPTVDVIHELKRLIHKFLDLCEVFYPGVK